MSAKAETGLKPKHACAITSWDPRSGIGLERLAEAQGAFGDSLDLFGICWCYPDDLPFAQGIRSTYRRVDSHDSEIIKKTVGQSTGLFFVDDAASATDHQDRKVIAAQDFVSTYKIKSVFGTGEAYSTGQTLVNVLFCRALVPRGAAERSPELL